MADSHQSHYHGPPLAPPVSLVDDYDDYVDDIANTQSLLSQIAHLADHHPLPPSGPPTPPDDQEIAAASILATLSDSRPPTSQGEEDDDMDHDQGGGISLLDTAHETTPQPHPNMSAHESDSDQSPIFESTHPPLHYTMQEVLETAIPLVPLLQDIINSPGIDPDDLTAYPASYSDMIDQFGGFATFAQSNLQALQEMDVQPDYSNGQNPNAQDRESFVDILTFFRKYIAPSRKILRLGLDALSQPSIITGDDLRGDECDLQGIDWSLLNVSRHTVRTKRVAFETSRLRDRLGHGWQDMPSGIPKTDDYFSFRRMVTAHRANISHFQLRNLLASTSRNDVFYSTGHTVTRTDATGTDAECVIDLSGVKSNGRDILISTLAAADNFVIAGGFYGEYALTNLASTFGSPTTIGRAIHDAHAVASPITNHISMFNSRSTYTPQAVLCSNDNRMRILDCVTNTITHSFRFAKPINCSATSPNGRLRVVVGDFNETFITNAETGQSFETLGAHSDDVFACDWADDGIHIATAAQDRRIVVWDARNWSQPLSVLSSELSIPRSLKFSPVGSGPRVLVSAESDDYVNVINAQTFETRQVFDFFGKIAGMSFCPDGNSLFVANSDSRFGGIMEFERSGWGEFKKSRQNTYTPLDWMDDDLMDEDFDIIATWQERRRRGLDIAHLAV